MNNKLEVSSEFSKFKITINKNYRSIYIFIIIYFFPNLLIIFIDKYKKNVLQ